jgi:LysM repeat protein
MMKHLTLTLILVSLTGCGETESPPAERSEQPATTPEAKSLPGSAPESTPTATPSAAPSRAEAVGRDPAVPARYTVTQGDTLYGIAKKHNLDYRELADWNGIRNPDRIQPGQELSLSPPSR